MSVSVPVGSDVVPAFVSNEPTSVTFVSLKVVVAVLSTRTVYNDDPFVEIVFAFEP